MEEEEEQQEIFEALDNIIRALKILENDESLLVQSGKPVWHSKNQHKDAPRILISQFANSFPNGLPGNISMNWRRKD
jgi:urocanate hydratase